MNYLIGYSLKNLTRNRGRSFLTLFAVIITVAILIIGNSYFGGVTKDIVSFATRESGHILIQTKEFTKKERMFPLDKGIADSDILVSKISEIKGVEGVFKRITFGGMFMKGDETFPAVGNAIDPVAERDFIKIENNIVSGSYFTGMPKEILLGVEIAKNLKCKQGDTVMLLTRDSYGSFAGGKLKVAGIFDFNTLQANRTFYISIDDAFRILKVDKMPQKIIIVTNNIDHVKSLKNKLLKMYEINQSEFDVFTVYEHGIMQSIFKILNFIFPMVMVFFVLIALMTISNTMMMSVLERTSEIGLLQSLGMKPFKVGILFVLESMTYGVIGSLIGGLIALPPVLYFKTKGLSLGRTITDGMPMPIKNVIYPNISVQLVLTMMFIGISIALIAGSLPALRAVMLKPAEAIREK
ncbi:MAG: hypothetical protein A2355_16165 [Spirochaetes bacterium RIFOXYB1_FULL_32_8]|nr:MAG: hypothetical protein A2Y30_11715 [Spirochaetes bacterium GWE1_32_154]OHD51185.1 MAG: hypothetical protein A2Y29_01255 [Spirochaetes bacterium GWE2_31_10]OHD79760.1 MAG: hypothetical protein A2355_16165 [Spirochaetes bacterium RIFOXYB1_FULL_32_8]